MTEITTWFFRIKRGEIDQNVWAEAIGVNSLDSAWDELKQVGAELLPDAMRRLGPDDQWSIEVLDDHKRPAFRIRVICEMLTP